MAKLPITIIKTSKLDEIHTAIQEMKVQTGKIDLYRDNAKAERKKLRGDLNHKNVQIQMLVDDILSLKTEEASAYAGNAYRSYETAVAAINQKYCGEAKWGVSATGNIIDVRAAFTIPQRLKVMREKEEAEFEIGFINAFLRYNKLDLSMPLIFSKESEIEGKFLCKFTYVPGHEWTYKDKTGKEIKETGMVKVRFISWTESQYKVTTEKDDYMHNESVTWKEKSGDVTLKEPFFTYRKFGGRINKPNYPAMKIWKPLSKIDSLDQAIRDWREINRLFAAPIPHIECEDAETAKAMQVVLEDLNFKIKKIFAHTGKLGYASPPTGGLDSLWKEIEGLAKSISGDTGVPVHFLGYPELMSNRSTAENLMELIWASTTTERNIWIEIYNEMSDKSIAIFNTQTKRAGGKTALDKEKVEISIPYVTEIHWQHLEKVLMPMFSDGAITLEYLLEQIPDLDVEAELRRREEEEKENEDKLLKDKEKFKGEEDVPIDPEKDENVPGKDVPIEKEKTGKVDK